MWMKNCWYAAGFSESLDRSLLARTILGVKVVLFRTSDGRPAALEDRCAHRYMPLSIGTLKGDTVQCRYHGLCYDSAGACVEVPGQPAIPAKARVRAFPIVERYRVAWIWMGDAAAAEPDLIPDVHWLDDPMWVPSQGYHRIAANYQLLIDNLLDLTHETFTHPDTIGNTAVAESPLTVTVVDGVQVRAARDMLNCEPPPFYVSAAGADGRIDRSHTTVFTPPGFLLIESSSKPAGVSFERARAAGQLRERRNLNLVTPETATTSHYFWASTRGYALEDDELTEHIREQVVFTFNQDKDILEAQQRAFDERPDDPFPVALKADAGAIQGRRLIRALIAREQDSGTGLKSLDR